MGTTQTTPVMDRSAARKVVGSLAILGAAAAVAGLGTFGTFTDSTTPLNTTVESGTVSINLASPAGAVAIPVSTPGFVPGDSLSRVVDLVNDGGSALSSVNLKSAVTAASILTTDTLNGLQLTVKSCGVAWTQGGTASAPTYTCGSGEKTVMSGPAGSSSSVPLASAASLQTGGIDRLMFTIALPVTADNSFQGKTAGLSLTFEGVQKTGTAR